MANTKISLLNALTGANVAPSTDKIPIVDTSATETKSITPDELKIALGISGTNTGDQDLSGYLLTSTAASTYATIASLSSYLTTSTAASTYQTLSAASTMQTAIDLNTAKVTNATHTGDVTGSGALTIASNAVTTAKIIDGAVTEAKITLADNTTNDFSTSKHGFVPKGTNTGKFLKDDGTWASIGGGGDALTSNPLSQFAATTSAQLRGVISDETGSGSLVFATSPTLVTPTLGVATATSINKVAITQPATGSTLTIQDGFTLTVTGNATVSGTNTGNETQSSINALAITTVGTIGTGTWNATTIATTKGGTGLTSYTTGDLIYASATNTLSKLAVGTNGYVLTLAGGVPTWAAGGGGGGSLSGLTAATATNTINNVGWAQVWQWNSLTTETALTLSSSSGTTGTLFSILDTSSVGATGYKGANISMSGTNGSASQTTYGLYVQNSRTGTTPNNVGIYTETTGGTSGNCHALYAVNTNVNGIALNAQCANTAGAIAARIGGGAANGAMLFGFISGSSEAAIWGSAYAGLTDATNYALKIGSTIQTINGTSVRIATNNVTHTTFLSTLVTFTQDVAFAQKTPASAAASGTAGVIAADTNYIYVCTATNTWKRVAIATW